MRFKHKVMLASSVAIAGITASTIYFLRQAVAETERSHEMAQAESDCAEKIPSAVDFVQKQNSKTGARIHVTGTAAHFNRRLKQCLVEVSTIEHLDTPVYAKTMVDIANHTLVLWSLASDSRETIRDCFSGKGQRLDCVEADKKWKTLMYE